MEDADFDTTWEAAQRGDYLTEPPAALRPADPPPGSPPPDANQIGQAAATPPAPATAGQGATEPSSWTPPTREQWEATQTKARHFDSFNGNFPKIEERWKAEYVGPVQRQLDQAQQELERVRAERTAALEGFLARLPPEQREAKRQEIAQYDQRMADDLAAAQAARDREAQVAQREAQAQAIIQRATQQEEANLRQTVRQSVAPYTDTLSQQFGVPKGEIEAYIKELGVVEFIDQAPTAEDLKLIGPLMKAVQTFATTRGSMIAAENARRAAQNGTYRAEGTGAGSGGERKSVGNMPDKDFEALWEAVKAGNNANRY